MNLSLDIATTVLAVSFETLPTDARHAARASLADSLAVMIGAVPLEPAAKPFHAYAKAAGGNESTLLAGGRSSPAMAALANGALMHALDFEDTYEPAGLHPNAAVIPAVLALAECHELHFSDLLTAIAVGADIACRIGDSLRSDPALRYWYHPPMIGAAGAAMGAAHLMQLTPHEAVAALSLVQTQFALTDGLKRSPGSHLRAVRDGFAARAAVDAVLMAKAGVVGTSDPLNEAGGLIHMLTGLFANTQAFESCGQTFRGASVSFKRWPCCRGTHEAIQLALGLRNAGVVPDDIKQISFTEVPPNDMLFNPVASRQAPELAIDAKFSVPFTFASALCNGPPGLGSFSNDALQQADTRALALRVTLDSCAPGLMRAARIQWQSGTDEAHTLPPLAPLFAGTTPFSKLEEKFTQCLEQTQSGELTLKALLGIETFSPETTVNEYIETTAHAIS